MVLASNKDLFSYTTNNDPTTVGLFVYLIFLAFNVFIRPNSFNKLVHDLNIVSFLIILVFLLLSMFLLIKIIQHRRKENFLKIVPTKTNQNITSVS